MSLELPFPLKPINSASIIENMYVRLEHTLSSDSKYHFRLAITKDWKVVKIEPEVLSDEKPIAIIGLLRRVNDPVAEIEVTVYILPREVHPADWLLLYVNQQGRQFLDGRELPSPFGRVGDYLTCVSGDNGIYAYRDIAIKDGNKLFHVSCRVAHADYLAVAEEFLMALQTFELMNPTKLAYAEPAKEYKFDQPMSGRFLFPASWDYCEDPTPPPQGSAFNLINRLDGQAIGQFSFGAIHIKDERDETGLYLNYLSELAINGLSIQQQPLEEADGLGDNVKKVWSCVLKGSRDQTPLEVRCCVAKHAKAWILFGIVGPASEVNQEVHMINCRAFDIAIDTFSAT